MIHYDLQCDKGHEFDGWFASSASYDDQIKRSFVSCTHCGSLKISKQLMAPGIPAKANRKSAVSEKFVTAVQDPQMGKLLSLMREFKTHVEATTEDVGNKFADEARKIHYEEADARAIRGIATPDEAKSLAEEGIAVHPLPLLPEDRN